MNPKGQKWGYLELDLKSSFGEIGFCSLPFPPSIISKYDSTLSFQDPLSTGVYWDWAVANAISSAPIQKKKHTEKQNTM